MNQNNSNNGSHNSNNRESQLSNSPSQKRVGREMGRRYAPKGRNNYSNNRGRRGRSNSHDRHGSSQKAVSGGLHVCTLSGTNEVGRNCNFIELGNDILVIDCGFSFPGEELYGIDYLIPNLKYLKKNRHRIRGILLTHGHLDHTGALPYVLPELDFPPIYAGRFANALVKERLAEFEMKDKVKFIDVQRNTQLKLGNFTVTFIGVTHSIPNAFSIFVESPKGNVFFSGDYKIDLAPANEPETDYEAIKRIRGRVDLALLESTNSKSEGKAKSETEISENLEAIVARQNGRIFIGAFSSLVSRLYSLIKIAQKTNRKVVLVGRSINQSIRIARTQNYINIPDNLLISEKQATSIPDNQLMFLCSGSQGERFSALNRLSLGENKIIKIKPTDTVILSASEIPSNVSQIERMTDRLIRMGAEIIQNDMERVHESGHALKMDMKMMYDLLLPKEVIPIHGSLTMRYKNKRNYVEWGMSPDKVHLTEDGQLWNFTGNQWRRGQMIESKPILIDGLGVGDTGDIVLKDRKQLAEYGMVTVVLHLSDKGHALIGKPKFISRGFVYMKSSQELFNHLEGMVVNIHQEWKRKSEAQKRYEEKELIGQIQSELAKHIMTKTAREPMILTLIL